MLKLFVKDKIHECNVCFENKESVQCLKCKNCYVCHDCLLSMCENGIADKCPHCRQLQWRKIKNTNKVFPINTENIMISGQKQTTNSYVYRVRDERPRTIALNSMTERARLYYRIMMVCAISGISWMCGFITIIVAEGKKFTYIDIHLITWVAFIIGLFEVHCFTLCCLINVCKHPIRNRKDYCEMFCEMQ